VLSGNNDGTISILRTDAAAGFAKVVAYYYSNAGTIRDMIYDEANGRIVILGDNQINTLGFDAVSGVITAIDFRPTSGNSSHLTLNKAGTMAYVASGQGTNENIDVYSISASGGLSAATTTPVTVDPDYITLNPDESRLYVVSRTDDQIQVFGLDASGSLSGGPQQISTATNPTALVFNLDGSMAYMTRANNTDNLVVYGVDASGSLGQQTVFTAGNNPIDLVLNASGTDLYTLDSNNKAVRHYSVDVGNGALTFVNNVNLSFTPTDLVLSHTGSQLYVGHSEEDLVSTLSVNPADGTLAVVDWTRTFNAVATVAAVGGQGSVQPTPKFLLAPDTVGLSVFSIAADGMLALVGTENSMGALIDGEVAVDYSQGLLLAAGEDSTNADWLTSYQLNPATGTVSPVSTIDATQPNLESDFQRLELGKAGGVMYVLDTDIFDSLNPSQRGWIRTYQYADDGTITNTAYDTDSVGQGPENLSLHPAGRFIYSVNSFGDSISRFEINASNNKISGGTTYTPGLTGSGVGRPLDMRFHPNGRYAYVSLQDDEQMVRYLVDDNGALTNKTNINVPPHNGADVGPGPIGVHPNGRYAYVGERQSNTVSVFAVQDTTFSLQHQTRVNAAGIPDWISIDPHGRFLYVRYSDENVEVFTISATTGNLTSTGQVVDVGESSGFISSLTIVAPLQ
jgi:6-phosphogluconolactonase (cycloisomerase 2 family)